MKRLAVATAVALSLCVSVHPASAADPSGSVPSAPQAAPAGATSTSAQAGEETFHPPPKDSIPPGPYGDMVKLGRDIFRQTGTYAPAFVGNKLRCSNCHLDAGRLPGAAPLWAAWVAFPAYRAKNKHVNTFGERLQGCFRFSMNGKAPPLDDKVMVALQSYAAWLAQGAPVGAQLAGRGYPRLPKPASAPDYARGQSVYQAKCALCHGPTGQGQSAASTVVFPPLWGDQSFNWGAGMQKVDAAAAFIKRNMPLGLGGTLSDQEAWDVSLFIDSQERPQDPRFNGSVAETRAKFHNSPWSMYGETVNGHVLGSPMGQNAPAEEHVKGAAR
ncbi:MAG TPA: c-type cytochrome [Rhodopila sp.]|nr:c-type cytochrome [Rhodopila sp.]